MTALAMIDRAPAARLPSPPGHLAVRILILAGLRVFGLLFVAPAAARRGGARRPRRPPLYTCPVPVAALIGVAVPAGPGRSEP